MGIDQRYYSSVSGRFLSPDPYKATAGGNNPASPQSWNKYAYVGNDPVNWHDPRGLYMQGTDGEPTPEPDPGPFPGPPGPQSPPRKIPTDPPSDFPECNPNGVKGIENELQFIVDYYDDAVNVANHRARFPHVSALTDGMAVRMLRHEQVTPARP